MRVPPVVVKIGVIVVAAVLGLASAPVDGLAAEEATVRAIAAWSGQGWFFPVGPEEALFSGVLRGLFFVEDIRGALDAAHMSCPISVRMHRITGAQTGEGQCVLTSRD